MSAHQRIHTLVTHQSYPCFLFQSDVKDDLFLLCNILGKNYILNVFVNSQNATETVTFSRIRGKWLFPWCICTKITKSFKWMQNSGMSIYQRQIVQIAWILPSQAEHIYVQLFWISACVELEKLWCALSDSLETTGHAQHYTLECLKSTTSLSPNLRSLSQHALEFRFLCAQPVHWDFHQQMR